jgi:small subunit ribosomal protein S15Ae
MGWHFFRVALNTGLCRMVRVSVLNDCLRAIVNAERLGKRQVIVRPSSKVIIKFLQTMMAKGYIGEFEIVDDHRGNKIVIELLGRINKCGVVTPRFDVALTDLERWIGTLLPSRQFGYLVLTTSEVSKLGVNKLWCSRVFSRASWITRRRVRSMWLARFWASSTEQTQ